MVKVKVTTAVVNRWGKRYIAKDWIIEVSNEDLVDFKWFEKVKEEVKEEIKPKKTKNESNKKRS